MNAKFELIAGTEVEVSGVKLFRIRALISFGSVIKGDVGGFVASEKNLSGDGNAWVHGNAQVHGDARVYGNAQVHGNAQVYGDARVYGNAQVHGNARVYDDAWVYGNAWVYGDARVYGNAQVHGNAWVYGDAQVTVDAEKTPIFIGGIDYPVTITARHLRAGCQIHTFQEWRDFSREAIIKMDGQSALKFYPKLLEIMNVFCKG
jgi:cytoskeletal protein CcmA (bactofilin family)